ncbi:MAG: tyrosine-type recombinase/integrase [Gammaproteobacteria bacterium]
MTLQRRAAQTLLKKRLDEVDRGSFGPGTQRLTFAKVADKYLASKVNIRPSTRRSYSGLIELYLKPYFGAWKIHQISATDIERYRSSLKAGLPAPIEDAFVRRALEARPALSKARARQRVIRKKPGVRTINKTLTLLVMVFNYATRHRWVDYNPAEHVEKLKVPVSLDANPIDSNILTPKEIQRLIEAAVILTRNRDGTSRTNNYRLLIKTAIFTGMRSGEIRGLQWGDIDWNSGQIHVRRSWKEGQYHEPKTKASIRRIEIPEFLISELREWHLACPTGRDDLVFPNLAGRPMSNTNLLQRGFYPALRRAGLRKIRFHDLRHTFASLLIANGEDIVRVSRLLGHASPTITLNVYSHMLPNEHYGSANRLGELVYGCNNHHSLIMSGADAPNSSNNRPI